MSISAYKNVVGTRKKQTPRTTRTRQTLPIPGEAQVKNNAGGYGYAVDIFTMLTRFLILGTDGGTFYVSEQKLTADNADNLIKCVLADGPRTVQMITDISVAGRAPKNDPAIFALAVAATVGDLNTRSLAFAALPKVCRIPTHLFHFVTFITSMRGIGRGVRNALGNWYNELPLDKLAYEVVKYQGRDGFTNADVLRLAHPSTTDPVRNAIYRWVVDGFNGYVQQKAKRPRLYGDLPNVILGFEAAKNARGKELLKLIAQAKLTREMVPTEALKDPKVWAQFLAQGMPLTAMLRNLGNMSKTGLLTPMSDAAKTVAAALTNRDALTKARVHPLAILVAQKVYALGHSVKGDGVWTPVPSVIDALNDAFYLAFETAEPTGKRLLYGVDVSGSMGSPFNRDLPLTSAEAAAALALASAKLEQDYYIMGFAHTFKSLNITKRDTLDSALRKVRDQNFGMTDCALPMVWAQKNRVDVDGFIVITDGETYYGDVHPSQALREYRQARNIPAKEIVIATAATGQSIADPKDPGTLDVAGFDTAIPQVISEFLRM